MKWFYAIIGLLSVVGILYGINYLNGLKDVNAELRLTLAKKDSIITINETTVLKLSNQLDIDKLEFDKKTNKLLSTLKNEYRQKIASYASVIAEYYAFKDSIVTQDTVIYNQDSSYTVLERKFATWITPDELYVAGAFQKTPPYLISFSDIRLRLNPQILITRDKDNNRLWGVTINTNSKYLKADDIEVIVDKDLQFRKKWSYFVGGGFGNAFNITGGIGYYDYSLYAGTLIKDNTYWAIGVMKRW